MIPLILAGLGAIAGATADSLAESFERRAARELATQLQGREKRVWIQSESGGILDAASGRLRKVTISAENFQVSGLPLFTEPELAATGRIGLLELRLKDFELRSLHVEELTADISECRFDFGFAKREGKMRLSRAGTGPGYVRINAAALERFILHKFREIKTVSVRLENDKIYVEGTGEFMLFTTSFYVSSRLAVKNGVELWLEDSWMLLDGSLPTASAKTVLLQALNPVLDIDADLRLFGAFQIQSLRSKGGILELWGESTVPADPRR